MRALAIPFLLAALIAVGDPSLAQQRKKAEPEEPAAPPAVVSLPPAYEKEMLRLAEVLGALHYLRELCGAKENGMWRSEMEAMIVAEEPTDERRQLLIASFNRGFRGFREVYRDCTPVAAEAANRYLKEGIRLSAEIPGRFGN